MEYIADLHVHSPFSRATSKESNLAGLFAWARVKGIQVVGTGDFTHPGWFRQLKEQLAPAEPGFFRLKNEDVPAALPGVSPAPSAVRFLLSAEVSSIYKRQDRVRKVHNLLYVPDFASAERISAKLAGIGNIESDGRPILGLDARDLLEIVLEEAPEGFLVPAHIWTPWFSLFGSRSGFDAIEECFGDLAEHVFALETGLSSDPDMNRLVSSLDRCALISNSDCHSPSKLGREANLFAAGFDYFSLRDALKSNRRESFRGTVEFFPEEGKYHFDGHRKCGVCLAPAETRRLGNGCPVCGRPLTVGVHHRVLELADREAPFYPEESPEFFSLVPLPEVLAEILGVGPTSKEVLRQYARTVAEFGSEFQLLLHASLDEVKQLSPILGEAVARIRAGRVIRRPGYDGEFGVIRLFEEGEIDRLSGQGSLFADEAPRRKGKKEAMTADGRGTARRAAEQDAAIPGVGETAHRDPTEEQAAAIHCTADRILVAAGPGTGKTFTLVARLTTLLSGGTPPPERICAITFTNKAADEVRERLIRAAGPAGEKVFVGTFHRFCLAWLRREQPDLTVLGAESRDRVLRRLFPDLNKTQRSRLSDQLTGFFHSFGPDDPAAEAPVTVRRYLDELERLDALDLDAVIPWFVRRLTSDQDLRRRVCDAVAHLFVDEFQDLNAGQFQLVQILARQAKVFAIGDPDQSIYGFRGSDLNFFFRFAELSGTQCLALTRNFRSAPQIVEAAGAVIARNSRRSGVCLAAESRQPATIELHTAPTPAAEAELIVRRIEELMGGISHFSINSGRGGDHGGGPGRSFGDIAVLYRLSKQAEELGRALERRGIPFQRVGATPFYMHPEVRAAAFFVWAAAGSDVMADWLALLQEIEGIGSALIDSLEAALPLAGDFFSSIEPIRLPAAAGQRMAGLAGALERFTGEVAREGLVAALKEALIFLGKDREHPDCRRLLELAATFGSDLRGFGRHLRQYAAATVYDERAEAVALMTLHAAKGLEFPVVFLAGLEEGLVPCALRGDGDPEEERRLFYVGLTRAKQTLVLTAAATRPWAGPEPRQLSRFVREIPERLVTQAVSDRKTPKDRKASQLELF